MYLVIHLTLLILLITIRSTIQRNETDLLSLYKYLLQPVANYEDQVIVKIQASLYQILEVHTASNYITVAIEFDMEWQDNFLVWNPVEFGGVRYLYLPSSAIWKPTCSVCAERHQTVSTIELEVQVSHTGKIVYSVSLITRTLCTTNVKLYPFDNQHCEIIFGSYIHMYNTFRLAPGPAYNIDRDTYNDHQEWSLNNVTFREVNFTWTDDPYPYSLAVIRLDLSRYPFFCIFTMVLPIAVVALVSLIGFHLPGSSNPFAEANISLGMATLLAMTFLLYGVTKELPKFTTHNTPTKKGRSESGIPILVTYYVCLLCQVAASAVFTSLLTFLDKKIKMSAEIPWIVHLLGTMTFVRQPEKLGQIQPPKLESESLESPEVPSESTSKSIEFVHLLSKLDSISEDLSYLLDRSIHVKLDGKVSTLD